MHHLLAFEEAVGTVADTDLDAITDDIVTIQNSHFFPSQDLKLVWAFACGATIDRAKIVTPMLRQITPPFIRPVNLGAAPISQQDVADYSEYPFQLRRNEEIAVELTSAIAMGTEQSFALLGVTQGLMPVPQGDIFTIRGTSTTAGVANTWVTTAMTWADTLPEGRYAVVGLDVVGAVEIAARLIFEEQTWRPGCVGNVLVSNQAPSIFRKGRLGVWGQFNNYAFPQVQILNTTTTAVHTAYMDLIRVG